MKINLKILHSKISEMNQTFKKIYTWPRSGSVAKGRGRDYLLVPPPMSNYENASAYGRCHRSAGEIGKSGNLLRPKVRRRPPANVFHAVQKRRRISGRSVHRLFFRNHISDRRGKLSTFFQIHQNGQSRNFL